MVSQINVLKWLYCYQQGHNNNKKNLHIQQGSNALRPAWTKGLLLLAAMFWSDLFFTCSFMFAYASEFGLKVPVLIATVYSLGINRLFMTRLRYLIVFSSFIILKSHSDEKVLTAS